MMNVLTFQAELIIDLNPLRKHNDHWTWDPPTLIMGN